MDIWQRARNKLARRDRQMGQALGFDECANCGQWFHHGGEDWVDCASCGRYCPECAESVEWAWCERCGLHYCMVCIGSDQGFVCDMCQYSTWDRVDG